MHRVQKKGSQLHSLRWHDVAIFVFIHSYPFITNHDDRTHHGLKVTLNTNQDQPTVSQFLRCCSFIWNAYRAWYCYRAWEDV